VNEVNEVIDCIIVGAGPAGLSAALYAARARLKIKIFESHLIGGQIMLTDRLDNYPGFPQGTLPADLIDAIKSEVSNLGVDVQTGRVEKITRLNQSKEGKVFKITCDDREFKSRSLIIATGASPKKLNIEGEEQFLAKGVSYCATCDGPMFKDKTVVVIGGGNAAVEEAIFLSRFVKKLYLAHRRDRLRAVSILQEKLRQVKNCEFLLNSIPVAIEGKDRVNALVIKNVLDNKKARIDCDGVFIFVGIIANTDLVKGLLRLDDKGFIIVDNQMRTSEEGIFACGDARSKDLRQVVTACSDGAQAAFSAQNFIIKY